MRLRWVAFLCLPILALSSSTPNVDPDIISIGFSAAFAEWASPHADWEGPTILPGVCDDRCVWSQEDDVQYIIEPGFTFHPPGHAATAGLRQDQHVILYCMEPTCIQWVDTSGNRSSAIAVVVGWHPDFDYWIPMECPVVAGLAYANPNDRLSYPDRILSAARHRVASVTANCLHWRDAATVDLMQRGVPVDNLGNCLHNVNESLIVTPATWSADQSTTHAFPSLQANKIYAVSGYVILIAFENSFAEHYVTEKLYDALLAGAVPLYVGAPNVMSDGYINPDCVLMLTDISPGDEWFDLTTMTLRYDADTVSATLSSLLDSADLRLHRMKRCEAPVSPTARHVQRCMQLLTDPHVSPFAVAITTPDGEVNHDVHLPNRLLQSKAQESTMLFCSLCDAAWKHRLGMV